ncbi:GntR family transcriptional regulator [Chachezhania sediminis]|uniref:GntR family transcriptional regulator n=1 Tax=Chachezhania sediminis TaxID=2599291 RepID=UPI00131B95FE|nr:GntR family transcriptional regulator [Chachezhania sediminis]
MAENLEQMLRSVIETPGMQTVDRAATLTEQVYDRLRQGLLIGIWEPGEKITARGVCKDLGVSLTPAREAMMRLGNEGALDVSAHRTYTAATLTLEEYREIAKIRLALEPMAVEAAVPLITDAQIDVLEEINETLAEAIREDRLRDALRMDSKIHLTVYRASGLPTLMGIIDRLWLRAGPTRNRLSPTYRRTLAGYDNHAALLKALRARNAAQARAIITRDLQDGTQRIIEYLSDRA